MGLDYIKRDGRAADFWKRIALSYFSFVYSPRNEVITTTPPFSSSPPIKNIGFSFPIAV